MQTESALRIAPRTILQFAMLSAPSHGSVIADIADRNERNHIQQCGALRRIANHQNQCANTHHNRSDRHERKTDAHTTSVAKPETATNAKYTVEAATTEDSNANNDPAILKSTANTGTP